jgi:flagellar basal-body rod protein FlgG
MLTELERNDVLANNLANLGTVGYRQDKLSVGTFPTMLLNRLEAGRRPAVIGPAGAGAQVVEQRVSFLPGTIQETTIPLDLALGEDGFFVVQNQGGEAYTRQGHFSRQSDGTLVTADGLPILGERGPIKVNGTDVKIAEDGSVTVDGQAVDKLRVVDFQDRRVLEKRGQTLFVVASGPNGAGAVPTPLASPKVRQGYLEMANVNPIEAITEMIALVRSYEASQRAIQAQDETLDRAVNEIAKF